MAKKFSRKHGRVTHIHEASIVTKIVHNVSYATYFTSVTIVVIVRDSADVQIMFYFSPLRSEDIF